MCLFLVTQLKLPHGVIAKHETIEALAYYARILRRLANCESVIVSSNGNIDRHPRSDPRFDGVFTYKGSRYKEILTYLVAVTRVEHG